MEDGLRGTCKDNDISFAAGGERPYQGEDDLQSWLFAAANHKPGQIGIRLACVGSAHDSDGITASARAGRFDERPKVFTGLSHRGAAGSAVWVWEQLLEAIQAGLIVLDGFA